MSMSTPPAHLVLDTLLARGNRAGHLAEEWKKWTGLPFVFALWAYRRNHPRKRRIHRILQEAMRKGLRRRGEIAKREAKRMGLGRALCERYLTRHIRYTLGPRERAGLRLFRKYHEDL